MVARSPGRMGLAGWGAARLPQDGIEPLAFIDNASARQGAVVDGVRVLSPADGAREFGARLHCCRRSGAPTAHTVLRIRGDR